MKREIARTMAMALCGVLGIAAWATIPVFVAVSALAGQPQAAEAPNLEGHYTVKGANPDGKPYTGEVSIAQRGRAVYVQWRIDGADNPLQGFGLITGKTLSVSYAQTGPYGAVGFVAVYTIDGETLTGEWPDGEGGINPEVLTKAPVGADHPTHGATQGI